jgi:hypothetical protein
MYIFFQLSFTDERLPRRLDSENIDFSFELLNSFEYA